MKSSGAAVFSRQNPFPPPRPVGRSHYHPSRTDSLSKNKRHTSLSPAVRVPRNAPPQKRQPVRPEERHPAGGADGPICAPSTEEEEERQPWVFCESWPSTEQSSSPDDIMETRYVDRFRHGRPRSRAERQQSREEEEEGQSFWWMRDPSPLPCRPSPTQSPRPAAVPEQQETGSPVRHPGSPPPSSSPRRDVMDFSALGLSDTSHGDLVDPDILQLQERAGRLLLRSEGSVSSESVPIVSSEGLGCSEFSSPGSVEEPARRPFAPTAEEQPVTAGAPRSASVFHVGHASSAPRPADDILFQWRLRRKMELARHWLPAPSQSPQNPGQQQFQNPGQQQSQSPQYPGQQRSQNPGQQQYQNPGQQQSQNPGQQQFQNPGQQQFQNPGQQQFQNPGQQQFQNPGQQKFQNPGQQQFQNPGQQQSQNPGQQQSQNPGQQQFQNAGQQQFQNPGQQQSQNPGQQQSQNPGQQQSQNPGQQQSQNPGQQQSQNPGQQQFQNPGQQQFQNPGQQHRQYSSTEMVRPSSNLPSQTQETAVTFHWPRPAATPLLQSDAQVQVQVPPAPHTHLLCDVLPSPGARRAPPPPSTPPQQQRLSRRRAEGVPPKNTSSSEEEEEGGGLGKRGSARRPSSSWPLQCATPPVSTEEEEEEGEGGAERRRAERRRSQEKLHSRNKSRTSSTTRHADTGSRKTPARPQRSRGDGGQQGTYQGTSVEDRTGDRAPPSSPIHCALGQVVSEVLFPTRRRRRRSPVSPPPAPPPQSPAPPPSPPPPPLLLLDDLQRPLEVIAQLLQEAQDSDETEFEDDPLLQVLRKQRARLKDRMSEVDSILEEFQQLTE